MRMILRTAVTAGVLIAGLATATSESFAQTITLAETYSTTTRADGWTVVTFTGNGSFQVSGLALQNVEILAVGDGGGGRGTNQNNVNGGNGTNATFGSLYTALGGGGARRLEHLRLQRRLWRRHRTRRHW